MIFGLEIRLISEYLFFFVLSYIMCLLSRCEGVLVS